MSMVWPTIRLVVPVHAPPGLHGCPVLTTLTLVSPAVAGAASAVAGLAAVPTAVTLRDSRLAPVPRVIVSPGYTFVTPATLTFVAPAGTGATRVVLSAGGVTWAMLFGCASRTTVTGGRGFATRGVVSRGIVDEVRSARAAWCHPGPVRLWADAVQLAGIRRAS